jgi:hypothetical protein
MEWNVEKYPNGATKFVATSSTGTSDQSYTVRLALAQALGKGVDKMDASSVIAFADAVLGLSVNSLAEVKKAVLSEGKYKFTDRYGKEQEIKVDHISHALQALDFLNKFKTNKPFKSSLSLEFDSLTSGFANKSQQMPILEDMREHLARTGVLTAEYQELLRNNVKFKDSDTGFSPAEGHAVSDVLHAGTSIGFFDSYQNLARTTIEVLKKGTKQSQNLTDFSVKGKGIAGIGVFNAIKPLLPGGEFMEQEAIVDNIGGALRNLFKEPFMIFNYSAGIKRIVTNLGINVAQDVARELAMADFSVDENSANLTEKAQKALKTKEVASSLLKSAEILDPTTNKPIKTVERLQAVLRETRLRNIKVTPFVVAKLDGENLPKASNLEAMLENVVKVTYGEAVKDVFEEQFQPFIDVQDAMNDSFKVAFRIFDKKRMDTLSKLRKTKKNKVLTLEDHAQVLEDLWDHFPWIVGPLTGSKTKDAVQKDVIAVASSSTRAPRPVEQARVSPQTVLGSGHKNLTRTITPLVRYLEEAVSAGSVLPFHAIDGAEMGLTLLDMDMEAFIAIHDALIGPIDQSDNMGFAYNKNMYNINSKDFVLADALQDLADRVKKTLNGPRFSGEYKEMGIDGLKAVQKGDTFPLAAKRIIGNLEAQVKVIKDKRELYYGENGLMKGAFHGNLVGTPGGVFMEGMKEPDLSYKEALVDMYDTNTDVPNVVNQRALDLSNTQQAVQALSKAIGNTNNACKP